MRHMCVTAATAPSLAPDCYEQNSDCAHSAGDRARAVMQSCAPTRCRLAVAPPRVARTNRASQARHHVHSGLPRDDKAILAALEDLGRKVQSLSRNVDSLSKKVDKLEGDITDLKREFQVLNSMTTTVLVSLNFAPSVLILLLTAKLLMSGTL